MKMYLHARDIRDTERYVNIVSLGTERFIRRRARNCYLYARIQLRLTPEASRIYTLGALMSMHITRKVIQ